MSCMAAVTNSYSLHGETLTDDVNGGELKLAAVRRAKQDALKYIRHHMVFK